MVRIFLLRQDPPLTHAGLWQARLTAERLKELAIERPAVLTSPALRCVQTARVLCRALQALLIVEPKLSDWTEVSEETWEMAQVRYEATLAGLSIDADAIVLCTHQAALEALRPAQWTQNLCALTELSSPLLHDCSAWRDRFLFVALRDGKAARQFLIPETRGAARLCPCEEGADFGSVVAMELDEAALTLTKSKRERHLMLFLHDAQGQLLHLGSGLVISRGPENLVLSKDIERSVKWR
ncbi:unnamed protein product [Effrenium voratum]|uniref:Uncharacterized protein n=1 Tax=Effrenium voratum TaxID=2562239 RepID=A0AA36IV82_9DINO|nr:unnamed protein product [Effrenium voratum]